MNIYALHRSAGTFLGVFLFIILLTGCWSLGSDALRLWWNRAPLSGELLPLTQLLALHENASLIQLPQPSNPVITFCQGMGQCSQSYSAINGMAIEQNTPAMWLVTLHKNLFIDFPGRILMSLFGFALAVLLISGLIVSRHKISAMMRVPRTTGLQIFLRDMHNWLGLWCYPWLILFAFTGAVSGLGALGTVTLAQRAAPDNPPIIMQSLMGNFHPLEAPLKGTSLKSPDEVLEVLQQKFPSFIPQTLMIREHELIIGGVRNGQPATANFEQYQFDREKGQFVGVRNSAEQALWTRAFIAIQPLHYGQYQWLSDFETWLSVMHFIAGLGACMLAASGLAMWCWRRSHMLSARFMAGSCGGLLLTACLLLATMPFSSPQAPVYFFACWGLVTFITTVSRNARTSLLVIIGLSSCLLLFTFSYSVLIQPTPFSRVDITLLSCGLFLLFAWIGCRKLLNTQSLNTQCRARSLHERSLTK